MSSLGAVKIELELDDKDFAVRVTKAKRVIKEFEGKANESAKSIKNIERSVTGLLPKLRDFSITATVLKNGLVGLYRATVGWQMGIIKTNAEIERTMFLLKGMSTQATETGRSLEAASDMSFLFDTAKNAPFSINELTNALVKFRSVGIEKSRRGVIALSDAVAQFGGNDDVLHRATVAIQQMAGKGTISMEELRQQLGEAVPTAIQTMADALGMSYRELVDAVSKGRVEAQEALERMTGEMERTMGGAGVRMMDTWAGMTSRLKTQWVEVQLAVGDQGSFKAAKAALSELIATLDKDSLAGFARSLGGAMATLINDFVTLTKYVVENRDAIVDTAKQVGVLYVAYKTLTTLRSVLPPLAAAWQKVSRATYLAGAAHANFAANSTTWARQHRRSTQAIGAFSMAVNKSRSVVSLAGAGLASMSGFIIPAVVTALAGAALQWLAFGSAAEEAWKKVAQGEEILSRAQLSQAEEMRKQKLSEMEELGKRIASMETNGMTSDAAINAARQRMVGIAKEVNQADRQIADARVRLANIEATRTREMYSRQLTRLTADIQSRFREAKTALRDKYNSSLEGDSPMSQEQYRAERAKLVAKYYEDVLTKLYSKRRELEAALSKGLSPDKASEYRTEIQIINERIDKNMELKDSEVELAATQSRLYDGTTAGGDKRSKLVGLMDKTAAKIAELQAKSEDGMVTLARFDEMLANGAFGKDGRTLLKGGFITAVLGDGTEREMALKDFREMLSLGDRLTIQLKKEQEQERLSERLRREAAQRKKRMASQIESIEKRVQRESLKMQSILAGGSGQITFLQRARMDVRELLSELPKTSKEAEKLRNLLLEAERIQATQSGAEFRSRAEQIRESLMSESDRLRAELERKKREARAEANLGQYETDEARKQAAQDLYEYLAALEDEYARKSETAAQRMLREWKDVTKQLDDATARWIDGAVDKLTDFVMTGKGDFSDLAESIIRDLIRIQIQQAATGVFGGMGSSGGWGGIFGAGGINPTSQQGSMLNEQWGFVDTLGSYFGFEKGGIMSSSGQIPLHAYESGGIANSPQIALFGEGRMNEAYVPLPDGKTIPVTMEGGMPNVTVNVINQSGNPVNAEQKGARMNGREMVLDVVLSEANKPGPFRDGMRGALK